MLEEFGLTKTEEKVYLALVRAGESNAADLIKKTQLHRTTVYDVLDRLIEKGVVSFVIKNKIKFYSSLDPSRFLDMLSEERAEIEKKQVLAKELISKIHSIEKQANVKSIAQIFLGANGKKAVMQDLINEGQDFIEFGAEGRFEDEMSTYTKQWAEQRRKKKIKAKLLFRKGIDVPTWDLNEIKFVSQEYQSPAATIVYGNKVAIFIDEEPSLIILIESEKLAKSYRNYFNMLWKIAEK